MCMERLWNETDGAKPKYWEEKNLSSCRSVRHKSDNDWPDTEWPKKELFIFDWANHHDDIFGRVGTAAGILNP